MYSKTLLHIVSGKKKYSKTKKNLCNQMPREEQKLLRLQRRVWELSGNEKGFNIDS